MGNRGSTNFDNRSFALNQEVNLTVYNTAIARRLEEIFQERSEIRTADFAPGVEVEGNQGTDCRTVCFPGQRAALNRPCPVVPEEKDLITSTNRLCLHRWSATHVCLRIEAVFANRLDCLG